MRVHNTSCRAFHPVVVVPRCAYPAVRVLYAGANKTQTSDGNRPTVLQQTLLVLYHQVRTKTRNESIICCACFRGALVQGVLKSVHRHTVVASSTTINRAGAFTSYHGRNYTSVFLSILYVGRQYSSTAVSGLRLLQQQRKRVGGTQQQHAAHTVKSSRSISSTGFIAAAPERWNATATNLKASSPVELCCNPVWQLFVGVWQTHSGSRVRDPSVNQDFSVSIQNKLRSSTGGTPYDINSRTLSIMSCHRRGHTADSHTCAARYRESSWRKNITCRDPPSSPTTTGENWTGYGTHCSRFETAHGEGKTQSARCFLSLPHCSLPHNLLSVRHSCPTSLCLERVRLNSRA